MNDDQTLNPTTPTSDEPIKLDEFGMPTNGAVAPVTPPTLTVTLEPATPEPVAPTLEQPPMPTPVMDTPTAPIETLTPPPPVVAPVSVPQVTEDLPLAFAGMPAPTQTAPTTPTPTEFPPVAPAPLPPVEEVTATKKKGFPKAIFGVLIAFVLLAAGSWFAYVKYAGNQALLAPVTVKVDKGDANKAAIQAANRAARELDPANQNFNGNKGQFENATGIDVTNQADPNYQDNLAQFKTYLQNIQSGHPELNPKAPNTCNDSQYYCGDGGGFCLDKSYGKTCIQAATDMGYTVVTGYVRCNSDGTVNTSAYSSDFLKSAAVTSGQTADNVNDANAMQSIVDSCANLKTNPNYFGNKMYMCTKEEAAGGDCVTNPITSIPSCFCGVVQLDTGSGHISVNGNCGCSKNDNNQTVAAVVSPSPSAAVTPTLACTSLVKDKADSAIAIGSPVTLTCAGATSPAGATTLSYKFRYNVNSGAWVSLTNATSTTASITPNQCGTYHAQCQTCGTINNVLVCDPTWTAAAAQ